MTEDHSSSHSEIVPGVEVRGLVKRFGEIRALDGLNLLVPAGVVYGILGPNGAGKTTIIRILATLLQPDGGSARVLGHDVVREARAVRGRISLTGQFAALDEDLTAAENLIVLARLRGLSRATAKRRAAALLEAFDLDEAADRRVSTYSGGMRRRVDLAASLIVTPDVLFLDEPTTGLDPRSRGQIWDTVRSVAANGTTVLLSTQYLDEADHLADRIAVVDRGRVIAEGTPGSLKAAVGAGSLELRVLEADERANVAELVARIVGAPVELAVDPAAVSARLDDLERVEELLAELRRAGIQLASLAVGQPRLDEVFLTLTGRPVTDTIPKEAVS